LTILGEQRKKKMECFKRDGLAPREMARKGDDECPKVGSARTSTTKQGAAITGFKGGKGGLIDKTSVANVRTLGAGKGAQQVIKHAKKKKTTKKKKKKTKKKSEANTN